MKRLRNEYEAMLEKVEDAQRAYEDAVRDRDDAIKSYKGQFNKLPGVVGDDDDPMTYDKYISSMQDIVSKTEDFHQLLSKLRDKGLSDSVYKQLLEAGTDALPFLDDVMLMESVGGNSMTYRHTDGSYQTVAYATPVICTPHSGLPEQVTDGWNGRLVPPRSPRELAEALRDMAASPERYAEMSRHALEHYQRNFTAEAHLAGLIAVLCEAPASK